MKYEDAQQNTFASGTVPCGYFGKREKVDFALMGDTIVTVADCGCYRSGLPDVVDVHEAIHTLKTHPSAQNITVTSIKGK